MQTRYSKELERLPEVYAAALVADIVPLARVVETWLDTPMLMIGSGGSYSTATFAAWLHERVAKRLSRAASPMEIIDSDLVGHGAVCFSASGRNRDICAAFKAAAVSEAKPLSALVMADETPLHALQRRYEYSEVIGVTDPMFKDGFLAVASLIASVVLLLRAYKSASGGDLVVPNSLHGLLAQTLASDDLSSIADRVEKLTARAHTSILFSNALKPTAIDLESRFVEASLGTLHSADLRNFGHGRHYWFAKRSEATGVLALISGEDRKLADRTLALLPTDNLLRLDFDGPSELSAISGLVTGLYISAGAGRSANIDPGKPSVPEFGRKLYRLGLGASRRGQKTLDSRAAIRRKTRAQPAADSENGVNWQEAYENAVSSLSTTSIGAIVLDYDGTLCDERNRFGPMPTLTASAVERLVQEGATIAVATGRGPSAGQAIRESIDRELWPSILMGYYNGAVIRLLDDQTDPLVEEAIKCDELIRRLHQEPTFSNARIKGNAVQISIAFGGTLPAAHAIGVAARALDDICGGTGSIVASSRSIDLLLAGQSKLLVVDAVSKLARCEADNVLRIGDKGQWPGNDAELLDHYLGLTVDESSPDPNHCWGLAPAGTMGLQATVYYLERIGWTESGGHLVLSGHGRRSRA